MNKESIGYTAGFALAICVVCSSALSLVSQGLKSRQQQNEDLDQKKNILAAAEIRGLSLKTLSVQDLLKVYDTHIDQVLVNASGDVVDTGECAEDACPAESHPVYIYRESGRDEAYIIPVFGKGLWSTIYGFLAVENDAATIRGVRFYKHGETPGLGGEVGSARFEASFKGKKIYDETEHRVRPVRVIKGVVEDVLSGRDVLFAVDGITGATMTSKGVSAFLDQWIRWYIPFFETVRRESGRENFKAVGQSGGPGMK